MTVAVGGKSEGFCFVKGGAVVDGPDMMGLTLADELLPLFAGTPPPGMLAGLKPPVMGGVIMEVVATIEGLIVVDRPGVIAVD